MNDDPKNWKNQRIHVIHAMEDLKKHPCSYFFSIPITIIPDANSKDPNARHEEYESSFDIILNKLYNNKYVGLRDWWSEIRSFLLTRLTKHENNIEIAITCEYYKSIQKKLQSILFFTSPDMWIKKILKCRLKIDYLLMNAPEMVQPYLPYLPPIPTPHIRISQPHYDFIMKQIEQVDDPNRLFTLQRLIEADTEVCSIDNGTFTADLTALKSETVIKIFELLRTWYPNENIPEFEQKLPAQRPPHI